jgi:hypothetical protein
LQTLRPRHRLRRADSDQQGYAGMIPDGCRLVWTQRGRLRQPR